MWGVVPIDSLLYLLHAPTFLKDLLEVGARDMDRVLEHVLLEDVTERKAEEDEGEID